MFHEAGMGQGLLLEIEDNNNYYYHLISPDHPPTSVCECSQRVENPVLSNRVRIF